MSKVFESVFEIRKTILSAGKTSIDIYLGSLYSNSYKL